MVCREKKNLLSNQIICIIFFFHWEWEATSQYWWFSFLRGEQDQKKNCISHKVLCYLFSYCNFCFCTGLNDNIIILEAKPFNQNTAVQALLFCINKRWVLANWLNVSLKKKMFWNCLKDVFCVLETIVKKQAS